MTKHTKPIVDNEPSLFADFTEVTSMIQSGVAQDNIVAPPKWEFRYQPDVDFISESEQIVAYCYSLRTLEILPSAYDFPVIVQMFACLKQLSQSPKKTLKNQAFTIYVGDVVQTGVFVLGIASNSAQVIDFISPCLKNVPSYQSLQSATSSSFMPKFRYDNGYIIEYSDEGLEGTSYVDVEDNYGSGLTVYRRVCRPPDVIGCARSVYGKLLSKQEPT